MVVHPIGGYLQRGYSCVHAAAPSSRYKRRANPFHRTHDAIVAWDNATRSTSLPRTSVNKGIEKGRGSDAPTASRGPPWVVSSGFTPVGFVCGRGRWANMAADGALLRDDDVEPEAAPSLPVGRLARIVREAILPSFEALIPCMFRGGS